jgi:hypothetical protein
MNDQSTTASRSAPPQGPRTVRRILRALSVLCLVSCGAVVTLWVRSYRQADRIHGRCWDRQSILAASKQGRVTIVAFRWHGANNWWQWGLSTFAVDDEMSFPVGSVRQYESVFGFGMLHDPLYMVTRSTFETPEGATILISGAAVATLRGSGIVVPYWFLVLLAGLLGIVLRLERPWRYTTRSLLIAITFVAIVLGLAAGLDHRPDPWTLDMPAALDEL